MATAGNRVLFADGFDHYATADSLAMYNSQINASGGSMTIASVGRRGGGGLKLSGGNATHCGRLLRKVPAVGAGFIFGWAFNNTSSPANLNVGTTEGGLTSNAFYSPQLSGVSQVWLRENNDGTISLLRGTTLLATSTLALTQGAMQFIEFDGLIHPSAGWVNVWVDGVNFIAITGANTQNNATATWDGLITPNLTSTGSGTREWDIDDMYCMDASGYATTLNGGITNSQTTITVADATQLPAGGAGAFRIQVENEIMRVTAVSGNVLTVVRGFGQTTAVSHLTGVTVTAKCRQGDTRWDAVSPTADGSHSDATLSTGTDHFAVVDDATPNGDTDYSTLTTVGNRESLNFPNAPVSGADILAVVLLHCMRKTDAGSAGMKQTVRLSGTDYDGPENGVASTYTFAMRPISEKPSDSTPFLDTDFNAAEFGQLKSS